MSLLVLLSTTACSFVEITLPERDHGDEGDHPCDTADTAADDDGDDTDDGDDSGDTDGGPGGGGHRWSPGDATVVQASGDYRWANGVWLADNDHDGLDDLIVTTPVYVGSASQLEISYYRATGDGSFAPAAVLTGASGADSTAPLLVDVDGDGYLDLFQTRTYGYSLFSGGPDGFTAEVNWEARPDTYLTSAGAADLDGDGVDEVVIFEQAFATYTTVVLVFGQDEAGALGITHRYDTYMPLYATEMIPVDFDGDGREAALWADMMTGSGWDMGFELLMYWGTEYPTAQYYSGTRFSQDGAQHGYGEDLNGDGQEELVSSGTDGLQVYDPAEGRASVVRLNDFENYSTSLVGSDLDGDGADDAVELLYHYEYTDHSSYTAIGLSWNFQDDGGLTESETVLLDTMPWSSGGHPLSAGDVDGDGCGDVALLDGYGSVLVTLGSCD